MKKKKKCPYEVEDNTFCPTVLTMVMDGLDLVGRNSTAGAIP